LPWVKGQGKAFTKAEIVKGIGTKYVPGALRKMTEKTKTLSFDRTNKVYSVPA
jgi:hypothetical protein